MRTSQYMPLTKAATWADAPVASRRVDRSILYRTVEYDRTVEIDSSLFNDVGHK